MDLIIDNILYKNIVCNLSFNGKSLEIVMPNNNFWRIFKDGSKYSIKDIYYRYNGNGFIKYGVLRESVLNHVFEWKAIVNFSSLNESQDYIAKFRSVKLSKINKPTDPLT